MPVIRIILGDQLNKCISSLEGYDKENDLILMCEIWNEATYVKHHKIKIAFLFSAMRHFAEELKQSGYSVWYRTLEETGLMNSFTDVVADVLKTHSDKGLVVTHPGEFRVLEEIQSWRKLFDVELNILEDKRFLCSKDRFEKWSKDRKQLRLEYFYRTLRETHQILMDGPEPIGGQWSYDAENRKPPKKGMIIPKPFQVKPDEITQGVITLVKGRFSDHFGEIGNFQWAVTRSDALKALDHFISERLPLFGDYQDAMIEGEPWMHHSHISLYLNCGLLLPLECIEAAEKAYRSGTAPLNAVEGFIRQILGWREYVRGIYWLKMPGYAQENFLEATRGLPDFYWSADTEMNCLKQCISETQQNAYAHHIQRLMVLGNFALLAGIAPEQVNEWFLVVYADAYEWVEMPNVTGMVLFADGGLLASKPYASGGNYINKMSNYCQNCRYKVSQKNGEQACPFNYLYWDFLARNRDKLENNHRLRMMYRTYDKMADEKKQAIERDSQDFFHRLNPEKSL